MARRTKRKRTRKLRTGRPARNTVPTSGQPATPAPASQSLTEAQAEPLKLTPAQTTFALTYLENGFNATQAYLTAHPGVTNNTARMEGSRSLANPCVRALLQPKLDAAWRALQMGGDEALARVARDARADIRLLYDEKGELLKPHLWPDEIAGSVKSVQDGPYGLKVSLVDPLAARRTILEQTGKLKTLPESVDALAAAIRADKEKNKDIPA